MYDIRVIEGGAGARLAVEAFEHLRVFGHFALEQLYGDIAFQCDIEGAEDCAHAAGCDDLAQLKLTNLERENDWMRTFAAGHGFQRWQIPGNPVVGFACSANGSSQGFAHLAARFGHTSKDNRCKGTEQGRSELVEKVYKRYTNSRIGW